jgi:hypothetical protein
MSRNIIIAVLASYFFSTSVAYTQELIDLYDGFVCVKYSETQKSLGKRVSGGFTSVTLKEVNKFIKTQTKANKTRLERINDAQKAVKKNDLGQGQIGRLTKIYGEIIGGTSNWDSQEIVLLNLETLKTKIYSENSARNSLKKLAKDCDEHSKPGPGAAIGATVQLVRLPMLPQYDYREAHFAWLVTTAKTKVGIAKKPGPYPACIQFTASYGIVKKPVYFGTSGLCNASLEWDLVDSQACDKLLPQGLVGTMFEAVDFVPKDTEEYMEQYRVQLLANPPSAIVKTYGKNTGGDLYGYCANLNY